MDIILLKVQLIVEKYLYWKRAPDSQISVRRTASWIILSNESHFHNANWISSNNYYPDLKEGIFTASETHVHLNFLSFPLSQILEMLKDHVDENCFAGVPVPQTQISMGER